MAIRLRHALQGERQHSFTTPLRLLLATTAALWMGAAQPQTVSGKVERQAIDLRFRDFFDMPVGPGGLGISDTLRQADGQTVRLVGYMVQQEQATPGEFMLAPRPVQMSEHADGEADDLPPATVLVHLDPAQQDWVVPHVPGLVAVSGTLGVARHEAPGGRVSWVRLQLGPDAARSMSAAEMSGYLHRHRPDH
jgi:hypothetical protein